MTDAEHQAAMVHIAHYGCLPDGATQEAMTPEQWAEAEKRLRRWGEAFERDNDAIRAYGFEPNTD